MKKILKSFLACTLSLLMCLGSVAFAGAEEAVGIAVSATEDTTILTNDFTTLSGGSENFNSSGNYGFCQGAYAETVIDVAEEGYYKMSVNSLIRTGKTISFSVYLDGEFEEKFTLWGDGTAFDYEVCDLHLKKGQQTLKIAFDCSTGSYHYLPSITLSKKAVASKSIWKNAVDVSDTAAYTQIAHNMYYTSAKAPIGYTINVPEGGAGLYQMYIQTARVDADITSYDVTVNGEAVMTSKATIPQNNPQVNAVYAVEQKLSPMCYVTLKEGENTVIFTNNGAFTYFSRLKFDKANLDENALLLNASGSTEISFADASLSNVSYVSDNGNHYYKFIANSSATVDLNVVKTGVYTMNVKALTRDGHTNTWNVYVDGVLYETYYTWLGSIWYEGEAIDIDFKTTGLHTIKIETPKANAYMDGFTLTKKATDNKAQWIMGKDATGTGSVTWEKYQIDNGGNVQEYAEYKVNAETAGIYRITSQTTYNKDTVTSAVLSVNGTEANVVTIAGGERGSYGDQKITTVLGEVYLNEGENTIRITNKDLPSGQTLMITRVKVEKVGNASALSATEPTEISFTNAALANVEVNHNGSGNYKFGASAAATVTVYVETPGSYTMRANILTRDQHLNTWNAYVDGVKQGTFYSWLTAGTWCDNEVIDLYFEKAGVHTIKIDMTNGNAYLNGFTLTKEAYDYQGIWILGKDAVAGTGSVNMEKYQIDNGGNVQEYAEYKVNVETAGTYRIISQTTYNTGTLTSAVLTVNGNEIGAVNIAGAVRGSYGDGKVETVLGEVSLNAGENTIRITNKDLPGGQTTMITRVKVDKISDEVSYDQRFHIRDYVEAYASQNTDTTQLKQDGANPDNTVLQIGNWATYSITIEEPGWYEYGVRIGIPGEQPQSFKAYVDDVLVSSGGFTSTNAAGDYSTRVDAALGKINFPEAKTYTLKIEKTNGNFAYASHVFLNYIGELPATVISATDATNIAAKDYSLGFDVSKSTGVMTIEGGNISFGLGDYVEYFVDVEAAGLYKLAVTTGCESESSPTYDIYVDGEFQHRQIGITKGWETFEPTNSYINLKEGRQIVRLENVGHPDFYLCNLAFNYIGDYIVPTKADTSIASNVAGGVTGSKPEIAFGVNAPSDGIYRLTLSARTIGTPVVNVYNNEKLLNVVNLKTASTSSGADNYGFIELKEGLNVVKINIAGGTIIYSDIKIAQQTSAEENALDAIISKVEKAENYGVLNNIIDENEELLGISFEALTDGIKYPQYVLIRLLNREYTDASNFFSALYSAVAEEASAPSLTTALENGTLTVTANTDIYEADGTFIVAVYEITSAGKRLKGINYVPYTAGTPASLTVADCSENYAVEVLAFNDMQKLQPITVSNGVYAEIFVAPNGSDEASGSEDAPFLTLARAKEEVASLRGSMTGDIIVNLAPGYYELSETEVFDKTHGGKGAYNVIYKGAENNASVIGGGKKVTGWTDNDGDGIYSASFTGSDVRDLYVNGYPAKRARSEMFEATKRTGTNLTAEIGSLSFAKPEELVTVWFNEWTNHYVAVEGLAKSGTTAVITLSETANFKTGTNVIELYVDDSSDEAYCAWHGPSYHKSFYLENALELLDEAGEFYYDKSAGMIYYKPYSEEDLAKAEVYASQIESLIEVSGTDNKNKVTNIVFDNLSFRYSTWNNNEIMDVQATQYVSAYENEVRTYSEIPSQITFNYANNVEIKDCEFTCLGSNALALYDAVTNAKVSGNIFRDLSGGAMVIGSYTHEHESENGKTCTDIEISDNVIRRTSLVWRGMPSITVYYEKDIDIVRNDIADLTYSGMSLGWGWGNSTARFGNFTVSDNRIHNVMQTLTDGGHIYTLGNMPGTVISNNYMTNSPDGRGGVYNDSGSGNIDILNNVIDIYKNATCYWWFQGSFKTHDLYADGNFAHSKLDAQQRDNGVNNVYGDNINIAEAGSWNGAGNAQAQAIIDGAGVGSEYKALINKAALPTWRTNPLVTP